MLLSHLEMLNVNGLIVDNEQWKLGNVTNRINVVDIRLHFLDRKIKNKTPLTSQFEAQHVLVAKFQQWIKRFQKKHLST